MSASTIADLETPTSLYLKLGVLFKPAFLLESVAQGEHLGRYSFIGLDPVKRIDYFGEEPLTQLIERELDSLRGETSHELCSALVGAIAFESAHGLLPTGLTPRSTSEPLASFIVPRAVLTFDHVDRRIDLAHRDGEAAARDLLLEVRAAMEAPAPVPALGGTHSTPRPAITREAFIARVERAKEYIRAGDIFQVVLSFAFEGETDLHPYQVYRALRHLNPSPYLYYLDFGDRQIIGSSPEALVKLRDNRITIRPIAGTRPRGESVEADDALAEELLADSKENAEHNMLVDLARNDVGRVAEVGSVEVSDLRRVERYSHVMHLCSTVEGQRAARVSPTEIFTSAFPAGTVSGAPKIRALQIIAELEPEPRGVYAGSVGYFTASGDMDHAIAIRTIVMGSGRYSARAGAGIVADSVPEREYEEICNKAAALLAALKLAEEL